MPELAIGVIAWNEEEAIEATLRSLFDQSLFAHLQSQGLSAEIICLANGCTDRTAELADQLLQGQVANHPNRSAFTVQTARIEERGKANAWNVFVHQLSDARATNLFLMDADIILMGPDTLWNMLLTLQRHPEASVSVDQPIKDIALKEHPSLLERLSMSTSRTTRAGEAQITGQLYCIRAAIARRIFLPREMILEDGFIKSLVCTDFLEAPTNPARVIQAPDAAHVFEAYLSPRAILRNQKRNMIGQTILHVLVDQELRRVAPEHSRDLGAYVRGREQESPEWLKGLIGAHVRRVRRFWRLFPDVLTFRFKRLARLSPWERARALPSACLGVLVSVVAAWMAFGVLKRGYTSYWPDTHSQGLAKLSMTRASDPPKGSGDA